MHPGQCSKAVEEPANGRSIIHELFGLVEVSVLADISCGNCPTVLEVNDEVHCTTLKNDLARFMANGSNIKMAKFYNNVIRKPLFDIDLIQARTLYHC